MAASWGCLCPSEVNFDVWNNLSSSLCRRSFHWQSLLPAADHRSFYHPSGSPGSLLWLLDAAGGWIFTLTCGRLGFFWFVCFLFLSVNPDWRDTQLFPFDRSSGKEKKKKVLLFRITEKLLSLSLSPFFPVLSPPRSSLQREADFTQKQYSGLDEKRSPALVFLKAIHLNSSLRARLLEKTWMSQRSVAIAHFWLYIHCTCVYVWL